MIHTLRDDRPLLWTRAGVWQPAPTIPRALLPGSFNPVHPGHLGLQQTAAEILGVDVAFELSLANVDKPSLEAADVERRLQQFVGTADVWLTQAARFVQKAALFPGATFVVGADTAQRLVDPAYYADEDALRKALEQIAELGCRFLVAARAIAPERCVTMNDLSTPARYRALFDAIPEARFRLDISSSALRISSANPKRVDHHCR